MRREFRVFLIAVAAFGWGASPVLAQDVQIDGATAKADWSTGSFSGSVAWDHPCTTWHIDPDDPDLERLPLEPAPYCGWIPYVTVGPGQTLADCSAPGRGSPYLPGVGVTVVWRGDEHRGYEGESFDVSDVALAGTPQPLLCLSVLEVDFDPAHCFVSKATGEVICPTEETLSEIPRPLAAAEVQALPIAGLPDLGLVVNPEPRAASPAIASPAVKKKKAKTKRKGSGRSHRGPRVHEHTPVAAM